MKAEINASKDVKAQRNVARCKRLKESIAKAKARGNKEREGSLQAELDRRLDGIDELYALKQEITG